MRGGRTAQRDIICFSSISSRRVRHTSRTTARTDMSTQQSHSKTRSDVVWSALFLFLCILFFSFQSIKSSGAGAGGFVCLFFVARCCWSVPNPFPCLFSSCRPRVRWLSGGCWLAGWLVLVDRPNRASSHSCRSFSPVLSLLLLPLAFHPPFLPLCLSRDTAGL